ncbi:MAG: GNAT family N-acetyltransferase [Firmicutes bacterium]|nr:GNAT family N-acetyltransferase [Bacillota bacterium]
MGLTIKRLAPELAKTFVEFFEGLDFEHSPHWASCYCMAYHVDCSQEQWQSRTGEDNRRDAFELIKEGRMMGYLAFDGEQCVGWCNANDAQRYLRLKKEMQPVVGDRRIGCVLCFVIHPNYRNQGLARKLLEQAVQDFQADDYEAVLALPVDIKANPQTLYRGTINMYTELGFKEIERHGDLRVMWLDL